MKTSTPLRHCSVLVTRPQHQAENFCRLLQQQGATVHHLPVIEIHPLLPDKSSLPTSCDLIIFTSSNAVQHAQPWINTFLYPVPGQLRCKVVAIGKKTAQHLEAAHIPVTLQPEKMFNSESLLALAELKTVRQKNILIIKGEGGRQQLQQTLKARGANIFTLPVYQRKQPIPDRSLRTALQATKIDIITLTSVESSENLFSLLHDEPPPWLGSATLLAGSKRIHNALIKQQRGNPVWAAKNPSDENMLDAVLAWKKQHDNHDGL